MFPESSVPVGKKPGFIDLPGMTLGILLRVQFMGIGSSRSRLIGVDPGNYLIIQTPPLVDIASKRHEKNHVIVSYLYYGRVYAFRCTLLLLVKEPYRFALLSYPESLENINLRKHERISCIIVAEVRAHNQSYEGIVSDISMGGCSFEFNRSDQRGFPVLNVQEEIIVSLQLKEKGEFTVFNTVIRAIHTDKESMLCGLQFITSGFGDADVESEKKLAEFLLTLQNGQ
jgi:c-di-GMP-binding flagellar brake protein YcgR